METKLSDPGHQIDAQAPPQDLVPNQEEGRAALRFFFKIAEKWRISEAEACVLLGAPDQGTFKHWKVGRVDSIPEEILYRLGDMVGISIGLWRLFPEPERGYDWLKKPNGAFAGRPALEVMLADQPDGLRVVRSYVDAVMEG